MKKINEEKCTECNTGQQKAGLTQFTFEKPGKVMLVGNVPGFECQLCGNKVFEEKLKQELINKILVIFEKINGRMYAYQFDDLIRDEAKVNEFQISDRVIIKDGVDTWDLYDENLYPGSEGTVVGKGDNFFDYCVEFQLKGANCSVLLVDIDEKDLEPVVVSNSKKIEKRKKATVS